jgi:hypothetical protein
MGTSGLQMNCWARHASTRDFYLAVAALFSPVQNNFFLAAHFFTFYVPIAQQPGQTVALGRLSLTMYLWNEFLECKDGWENCSLYCHAPGTSL